MSGESIASILISNDFKLPYFESEDLGNIKKLFDDKIIDYIKKIAALNDESFGEYIKDVFIERLEAIRLKVCETLELYLDGFPSLAFDAFNEIVSYPEIKPLLVGFRTISLPKHHLFFRTQKEYNVSSFLEQSKLPNFTGKTPLELFHVPFNRRKTIGANRFSIPGYPSLYLSESLETSWSEVISANTDSFHSICFRNHRPLYILDFSPINYSIPEISASTISRFYNHDNNLKYLLDYALIYPLILACHLKINYRESYKGEIQFKSEYILPQLLMQWYRQEGFLVDGMRYLSCTAKTKLGGVCESYFNYVVPVASANNEEEYCQELLHIFSSTKVLSTILEENESLSLDALSKIRDELKSSDFYPLGNKGIK